MSTWNFELSDGNTGTVEADDTISAYEEALVAAGGIQVINVHRAEPNLGAVVVRSPSGTTFAITVDDEGVIAAAPIES